MDRGVFDGDEEEFGGCGDPRVHQHRARLAADEDLTRGGGGGDGGGERLGL